MGQRFLFRCDAGRVAEVGTGHVRRCITLAQYLRQRQGASSHFVLRDDPHGTALVEAAGFPLTTFDGGEDEAAAMALEVARFQPHVCVLDVLDTRPHQVEACRRGRTVVVTLDDRGAGPELADLTVNAIRESPRADHNGPRYLVLPPAPEAAAGRGGGTTALLSFGGYDHRRLAQAALDAVARVPGIDRIDVVASAADAGRIVVPDGAGPTVQVHADVPDFPRLMAGADVAVVSGGLTLFEAMRAGVPAIVAAQYEHQAETARRYDEAGAAVSLGLPGDDLPERLRGAVADLVADPERRRRVGSTARRLVDGRGLERVADLVSVCRPRPWDTDFFGRRVAELTHRRLTPALVEQGLALADDMEADCVYYLADCHHPLSVQLAERHGFHFVDIRLTFEHDLQGLAAPHAADGVRVRTVRREDVPTLKRIAGASYHLSRYYFDQNFPRERCTAFYTEWIGKSCNGYVDAVLVADVDDRPAGYITCRMDGERGAVELVGIDADARGRGVGRSLVGHALAWFQQHGARRVEVVTQGRNYAAQRLYQRAGFVTLRTELWYHKWFHRGVDP